MSELMQKIEMIAAEVAALRALSERADVRPALITRGQASLFLEGRR